MTKLSGQVQLWRSCREDFSWQLLDGKQRCGGYTDEVCGAPRVRKVEGDDAREEVEIRDSELENKRAYGDGRNGEAADYPDMCFDVSTASATLLEESRGRGWPGERRS